MIHLWRFVLVNIRLELVIIGEVIVFFGILEKLVSFSTLMGMQL